MVALGLVALAIFTLGGVTVLTFAPPGQKSGVRATVLGVYPYDPARREVTGDATTHFSRDQAFAARVDWSSLPAGMVVGARWYNTLEQPVGGVGPGLAGQLASRGAIVPVKTPPGLRGNLPGSYALAVVRYSSGRPVELLARQVVLVERGD
jgi:hypothetical protein